MTLDLPTGKERRLVSVLFADLSGYTALCEALDPEEVLAAVRPVMDLLIEIAERHGGAVPVVAGDGLLVVFGAPRGHEDDPDRALRAAEEMRAAVSSGADRTGRLSSVHTGVASGEVLVSTGRSLTGWQVTGGAVNVAARLSDLAEASEVLVDAETSRLCGPDHHFGPSRQVTLRGLAEPAEVRPLLAAGGSRSTRPSGPFVGREADLEWLNDVFTQTVAAGFSQVVEVIGEGGVGKTRLAREWLGQLEGACVGWGACTSYGQDTPLGGLLEAVLDLNDGQVLAPAAAHRLFNLRKSTEQQVYSRDDPGRVEADLRAVLAAVAADECAILIVDDVHWAAADATDLLTSLVDEPLPYPILIVLLSRGAVTATPRSRLMDPLDRRAARRIVAGRLGEAPDEVVELLLERAGGNPFFLEACVALLVDTGVVTLMDGVCTLNDRERLRDIPTDTRLFIGARLDALPRRLTALLRAVSTCGDAVEVEVLEALVAGAGVREAIGELVGRGLLRRSAGQIRFSHRLIQEVAYAGLAREVRASLHARLVDRQGASPALRAFHAETAWQEHLRGDARADAAVASCALTELLAAGDQVLGWQVRGAAEIYRRGLAVIDADRDAVPLESSLLLSGLAVVEVEQGEVESALTHALEAEQLARSVDASEGIVRARIALASAQSRLGLIAESRSGLQAILVELSADDNALTGRVLEALGHTWRYESPQRHRMLVEQAHAAYVSAGDRLGRARCARMMAYLLSMTGGDEPQRWITEARRLQTQVDLRGQATLLQIEGFVLASRAEWRRAFEIGVSGRLLSEEAGFADLVVDFSLMALEAATFLGSLPVALAIRQELLTPARAPGGARLRLALACESALLLVRAGLAEEACAELDLAESVASKLGNGERMLHQQALAEVALDTGAFADVAAPGEVATTLAEGMGGEPIALQCRLLIARARLGDNTLTVAEAEHLVEACTEVGLPVPALMAECLRELVGGDPVTRPLPGGCGLALKAMWLEATGAPISEVVEAWRGLGDTVWLARALTRAGEQEEAEALMKRLQPAGAI